jgi:LacI family transcriptional regulator
MTTAIVLPDIANVIFPPIVRGVESVLEPLGYASFIVNTDNSRRREERLFETLLDRGVDGVVHAAASRDDPAALELVRQGVPVVTVNRRIDGTSIPFVVNDEDSGIEQVVGHLWDLGHRAVAHIAGQQDASTGFRRLEAFGACCEARGLGGWQRRVAVSAAYTQAEGRRCMEELLSRRIPMTAVVAANDMLALGAIAALRAHGLRCPEDISVTGFNDMPFLDLIPPALTTVRIEQFAAGAAAAGLLVKLMRGDGGVESDTLPVRLRIRDSTGRPPGVRAPG